MARTGKTGSHIPPPGWKNPLAPQQPLASARWLLAAVLATLGFAVLCVYITICLLFWQGQWQLTFHPASSITSTPASVGLKYDEVQFDATETGVLQLNGWWIPAGFQTPANTLLLLHGASGNLSDTVRQVQILHQLGLNLFVFDYRGFGKSRYLHPSEASTNQDADAAWSYLTETRHLAPSTIALDGVGLGAAIAAETARRHPQIPALILEDPQPPVLESMHENPQTRLLPVGLLLHDRFNPTRTLAGLRTPKLLVRGKDPDYLLPDYLLHLESFLGKYLPRP